MKILFTKTFNNSEVFKNLNKNIQACFINCIDIKIKTIAPFNLGDSSLIFTSKNAVDSFFKNDFKIKENKIFCVGKKTEIKLQLFGFKSVKTLKNAKKLSEYLIKNYPKEVYLHFCGNLALDIFDKNLLTTITDYKKVEIYRTELLFPKIDENYNALVFFSPSGVRSFAKYNSLENHIIFSIGKTTSSEIKNFTKQDIITSKEENLESLLILINNKFKANLA